MGNEAIAVTKAIERWPQDDDELWWFVYALWGIRLVRHAVCEDHCAPFEAFADAYFGRSPVAVWEASRGFGGKTQQLSVLCLTEAVTYQCGVTILGGSGAQSLNVKNAADMALSNPQAPTPLKNVQHQISMPGGGWIRALTASEASVRGPHPLRLRLDEIDEMEMKILEAAQGQPMKIPLRPDMETQTVMSSTHQYPDGTMTEILQRAEDKGWPVYRWCFKETSNPIDGWLTEAEVKRKQREITRMMWETEYELQAPSIEGRAIDSLCVELAFNKALGEAPGDLSETIMNESPGQWLDEGMTFTPNHKAPYVTSVDWAKEKDMTVVATFRTNCEPWRCVAWRRFNKAPWPVTVHRAQVQWRAYGGRFIHDSTGLGDVIDDYLDVKPMERRNHVVVPLIMSGPKRTTMFNDYIAGIENGEIVYPRIDYAYKEHLYCTNEALFATGGHPPDSFVAGALAFTLRPHHARRQDFPGIVSFEKASSWMGQLRPDV